MGTDEVVEREISAVILENHPVVANGVRSWCQQAQPPITLIDARANLNHAWTGPGGWADVVVFDLCMRIEGKPEFTELGRLIDHGRNVVVFSGETSPEIVLRCTRMGIKAFVTKDEGPDHLIPAIVAAAAGESYTAPDHSGFMAGDNTSASPKFTPRELDVMIAYSSGSSVNEIARRLHLSPKTVASYLNRAQDRYRDVGRPADKKVYMLARLIEDDIIRPGDVGRGDYPG